MHHDLQGILVILYFHFCPCSFTHYAYLSIMLILYKSYSNYKLESPRNYRKSFVILFLNYCCKIFILIERKGASRLSLLIYILSTLRKNYSRCELESLNDRNYIKSFVIWLNYFCYIFLLSERKGGRLP